MFFLFVFMFQHHANAVQFERHRNRSNLIRMEWSPKMVMPKPMVITKKTDTPHTMAIRIRTNIPMTNTSIQLRYTLCLNSTFVNQRKFANTYDVLTHRTRSLSISIHHFFFPPKYDFCLFGCIIRLCVHILFM